jgi:hypothetical protein
MTTPMDHGREIEKSLTIDRVGAGLLLSVAPARMAVWAAVLLIASVIIGHLGNALAPTMDFAPNPRGELTLFQRLFMFSQLISSISGTIWYLALGLLAWACAREISGRAPARN